MDFCKRHLGPTVLPMSLTLAVLVTSILIIVVFQDHVTPDADSIKPDFGLYPIMLHDLAQCELTIYQIVTGIDKKNQNTTQPLLRYLNDYEGSSGLVQGEGQVDEVANHPLLAFRMLYRVVRDLKDIPWESHDLHEVMTDLFHTCPLPREKDLEEAMSGLLRLAFTYDLDLLEFSQGDINGKQTQFVLQPRHTLAVGTYALKVGEYHALAVEWLELTRFLSEGLDLVDLQLQGIDMAELNNLLELAVSAHDKHFAGTSGYANTFFVRKIVPRPEFPYEFDGWVYRRKQRTNDLEVYGGVNHANYREINYWGLCSGQVTSSNKSPQLSCWYDTSVPLFRFKIELVSTIPQIIQIHHFLSDSAVDSIIAVAERSMHRSLVEHDNQTENDHGDVSLARTSYTRWLYTNDFPPSTQISALIESVTGLNVQGKGSEPLQVATYTSFGAHYAFHLDEDEDSNKEQLTSRIATFMIYLTDVDDGGGTVFIDAQIAVKPSRGSAVFWYNLDPSGRVDYNTHHAACPVLRGTKWVANKWIHYHPQFNVSQCPADFQYNLKLD